MTCLVGRGQKVFREGLNTTVKESARKTGKEKTGLQLTYNRPSFSEKRGWEESNLTEK